MSADRLQYTAYGPHVISCMGDSLTDPAPYYGVRASLYWPELVASALRDAGATVVARNFGVSGDTTCGMLGRIAQMTHYDVPDVGVIFGGVNDAGAGTTVNGAGASTTAVPVQTGKASALVGGYVVIGGERRLVASRSTDTINLATPLSGAPANGAAVTVDTQANLEAMVSALTAAGCDKNLIISAHYLNYSSGGDTTGTPYAPYATLRGLQQAAATASGASYCDLYDHMRTLIVTGVDAQGSNSWHAYANNQHLNTYGQEVVASAVTATIEAQSGWVAALS